MKILLSILICCYVTNINGQQNISLHVNNILPSNHVYMIDQDSDGHMWFATNKGLVKYDGLQYKVFTQKEGLPNNDTWYIEADDKQRIWYVSKNIFQGYIKRDSIYKFATIDSIAQSPLSYYYYDNNMYFSQGIHRNRTVSSSLINKNIISPYHKSSDRERDVIYNMVGSTIPGKRFILNDSLRNKVIVFTGNKYTITDLSHTKLFEIPLITKIPKAKNHEINDKGYVIRIIKPFIYQTYFKNGINFLNLNTKKSTFYNYTSLTDQKTFNFCRTRVKKDHIQVIVPNYLFLFDHHLDFIKSYYFPKKEADNRAFIDRDGNVWLANFVNGVTFIPKFKLENSPYFKDKKIAKISVIDDRLYIGVDKVGFFEKIDNQFQKIADSKNPIYKIKKCINNIFFISYLKSSYLEFSSNKIRIFKDIHNTIISTKDILFHNNETHTILNSYYQINDNKTGEIKNRINIIGAKTIILHQNKIFIGTSSGLKILNNNTIDKLNLKSENLTIPINDMQSINKDLFVGTDGQGVYVYRNHSIIPLIETNNLSIQKMLFQNDILWLATQDGVKKIQLNYQDLASSQIVDEFYKEDGLLQNNINDIAILNDTLYAGTDIGLSYINLKDSMFYNSAQLYINSIRDSIQYNYDPQKQINIKFGVIDYIKQNRITYSYRLLPQQLIWSKSNNHSVNFTNLSPGKYTLEIKATDHHSNQTIKSILISVLPLWYQTSLARILFALLILIFIFIIFWTTYKIVNQKKIDQLEKSKKIIDLELKALRSQMNPHFIHNSLNAILYYIQKNEVVLSKSYLKKFSSLVNHFFEYGKSQTITLKKEIEFLDTYLEIEKLRFEDKLKYTFNIDPRLNLDHLTIPSMLLQPIVENAVNHGIFHKKGNGVVSIKILKKNNRTFIINIEDNGIGIEKSIIINNRHNKNYRSKSSDVLKERLQLLKESDEWNLEYQIKDLATEHGQTGTLVILTINRPINN